MLTKSMATKKDMSRNQLQLFEDFVEKINKLIVEKSGGSIGENNNANLAYSLYIALKEAKKREHHEDFYKTWAARTLVEISQTHPFVDGNKRTGYVISKLILNLGKLEFEVDYEKAVSFLIKIASKRVNLNDVYEWVDKHSLKLGGEVPKDAQEFIEMLAKIKE